MAKPANDNGREHYRPAKDETPETARNILHFIEKNLDYNSETGEFRWTRTLNPRVKSGMVAGMINDSGYRTISINSRHRRAHRLAWLIMTGSWPEYDVDHINGDRDDNRWCNLRHATRSQNMQNGKLRLNNVSGVKGVAYNKRRKTWHAAIKIDGVNKYLGRYSSPDEAKAAYDKAANDYFGEFARSA